MGVVVALGVIYVAYALGRLLVHGVHAGELSAVWFDAVLVAGVGVGLLYGGHWIVRDGIDPAFYTSIAGRCLGGFVGMAGLLAIYHYNPATSISTPEQSAPVLTALSSAAGFGIGLHRARANELQRTKERLEASNERFEQFAYAISHDLRQPLRTVTSYLQLIERRSGDDLDERDRELFEQTLDGADRMREMIDGLLEYTQIDATDVSHELVDCEALFEDVVADLDVSIRESGAELTVESLPEVRGDRNHLRLLFQNLLENAIKYTDDGPPRIRVESERIDGAWRISVSDDGIGVAPDTTDKIFELFRRGHRQAEFDGTGLGLALCDRIATRHDGDIWVESELGEGSTFHVTLPSATDQLALGPVNTN